MSEKKTRKSRPKAKPRKAKGSGNGKPRTPKEDETQQAAARIRGGAVITLVDNGVGGHTFQVRPVEGTTMREIPTLLRQAASSFERQLIEG